MTSVVFLDIPSEIPLTIYHELFRPLTVIISAPWTSSDHHVKVKDHERQDDNHVAILFTNRQVRNEARPVLLSSALFDLASSDAITIIPSLEFLRMTRIIISQPSILKFLQARESFFRDMGDLLTGKEEIQIEITLPQFSGVSATLATMERHLRNMLGPEIRPRPDTYLEKDLLNDCISAMYPKNEDDQASPDTHAPAKRSRNTYRHDFVLFEE